ncbi:energy-coupling factor transporter ATPase [Mycoplasmopsis opalescens]|uniref:energy-coupling factor transporter ATPase n=1 Tax=Mycoplasmopsis opalescens TaxID=114886 RepID=UPI0004A707EA|nr:energy-coupling factor transporter ATPase [Mycoplasmopsis opalescens]
MQITVNGLTHIFSKKTNSEFKALDDVSCQINQGEFIGIIGSTGSGKTTFIEHLNTLLLPTVGKIDWVFPNEIYDKKTKSFNKSIEVVSVMAPVKRKVKRVKDIRKKIGVAFQFAEYQLFEENIEKDIMFGPISYGLSKEEAKERAKKYIKIVGLDESYLSRSPFALSGGQKRRVALAGILAIEPEVLVVDEPTAGLDPQGTIDILEILRKLNEEGKTIIMVSHDLDNVLCTADRVLLFNNGKIASDYHAFELLSDIDLLEKNNLEPPKVLAFVSELKKHGIVLPPVKTIDELADAINNFLESKDKGGTK